MEPLLREMYSSSLGGPKVPPPAQSASDRREGGAAGLRWERKGSCEDLIRGGPCQNKKEKRTRHRLEAAACEEQLVQGVEGAEQNSLEENIVLQQKANGEEPPFQGGDLLVQKERLESGSWKLDFECEPDHEEIYWGCFYFFPWLRMCRRDKREQP